MLSLLKNFKAHPVFGFKHPYYTNHALQRYAQRVFNVSDALCFHWVKMNKNIILRDMNQKIFKGKPYEPENAEAHRKLYGDDLLFIKYKHTVFVVREHRNVVTCYVDRA